ncbi:MAG TPA: alkaline phosphatase family protein [Nocardioidaceae bacterium]|nr:alkaline phosphatase family protein [Nocardioidaceae bacterium]
MRAPAARRGFAAIALVAALLGLVGLVAPATATPARPEGKASAVDHRPATPLHHLVVMMQSGHSFDNYLGRRSGDDGIPRGVCVPVHGGTSRPCLRPHPINGSPHANLASAAASEATAVDGGRMDGFVRAQAGSARGGAALGYYPPRSVPVLTSLANHGEVFDHWFAAVPGDTIANRLFAVTGAVPAGDPAEVPASGWSGATIFDRLQAADVAWRIYVEDYRPGLTLGSATLAERRTGQLALVPLLASSGFRRDPALSGHVVGLGRYYADLAHNRLPAVSFVVSTTHTERPPHNPAVDQELVRSVANALLASSAWSSSAFLLTYDTSGGWYDHVPPTRIDGARTGLRVPTILVSPYVKPDTVDHTTYDSASVLGLIEHNWRLPSLTGRDRTAASLLPVFSFRTPPGRPALIDARSSRPPLHQPRSLVLYGGYLLALAAGLGCVGWVLWREHPWRAAASRP